MIRHRILSSIIVAFIFCHASQAQKLVKTVDFAMSTPFLEPDGRKLSLSLEDGDFITLAKVKGKFNGSSEYLLQRWSPALDPLWTVPITYEDDEEHLSMERVGGKLALFTVRHRAKKDFTILAASTRSLVDGNLLSELTIDTAFIKEHMDIPMKAAPKEDFNQLVSTGVRPGYVAPLAYQYELTYSNNRNFLIAYRYIYSKRNLEVEFFLMDSSLKVLENARLPINPKNIVNGMACTDDGQLILLNTDYEGKMTLIRYNFFNSESDILVLDIATTYRLDFRLHLLNSDVVYVGNVNELEDGLSGVQVTKFDFASEKIDEAVYYRLSDRFLHDVDSMTRGREDWKLFNMHTFEVADDGSVTFSLEKMSYRSLGFSYDKYAVENPDHWKERQAQVTAGPILLFHFSADRKVNWEQYLPKEQSVDAQDGLNTASHIVDLTRPDQVRVLFATADAAAGAMNGLNYFVFDRKSGLKLSAMELPNPNHYALVRPYTQWTRNALYMVGKKGLLGKRTYLLEYDLAAGTVMDSE